MFSGALQPMHLIVILVIVLLVFGPSKLPDLGASLGKSMREFRKTSEDLNEAKEMVSSAVSLDPTRPKATTTSDKPAATAPLPSQPEARHAAPVTLERQEIE